VAEVLPGVRLGADDVADRVTLRHLLTHTSGIDGNVFVDTGRGRRLHREVRRAAGLRRPDASGRRGVFVLQRWTFVLLGRIIEVLDGVVWELSVRP
jgi:CubicO group peptidase (beta-lactamase class C family)